MRFTVVVKIFPDINLVKIDISYAQADETTLRNVIKLIRAYEGSKQRFARAQFTCCL